MIHIWICILFILIRISKELDGITNIVVLPFKTYKEPYKKNGIFNISSFINNHIYTEIMISNMKLIASFKSDLYGFHITSDNCMDESDYLIQKSKTFYNITSGFGSESMLFYRDINLKTKQYGYFEKMKILSYNNNKQCALFGLKMREYTHNYDFTNFILNLKNSENILNYKWTLKYDSDDEGQLVVGDSPSGYIQNFNKSFTEYNTYAIERNSLISFGIRFNEINFDKLSYKDKNIYFYHDINGILVDYDFYNTVRELFFTKYFQNYRCRNEYEKGKYGYIICNSGNFTEKDMKSFPTIYFKNTDIDYIFELNYKDLFFQDVDGEIYFLIILDMNEKNSLIFGKPFLKKYTFTVDNDSGIISFFIKVNENDNKNNKYLIIIILSIICFALLSFSIIFGYKYFSKKTKEKKRANELDEDYEYSPKENNNNKGKDESLIISNLGI